MSFCRQGFVVLAKRQFWKHGGVPDDADVVLGKIGKKEEQPEDLDLLFERLASVTEPKEVPDVWLLLESSLLSN